MRGLRTIVKLNGVPVTDYGSVAPTPPRKGRCEPGRGPRPEENYIAIQHHGIAQTLWFKEITLIQ